MSAFTFGEVSEKFGHPEGPYNIERGEGMVRKESMGA